MVISAWDATAWSLAAAIAERVEVRAREATVAADGYDGLFLGMPGTGIDDSHVELQRGGPAMWRDVIGPAECSGPEIWTDLATGRRGIAETADPLATRLSSKAHHPGSAPVVNTYRLIAAAHLQAALHGIALQVRQTSATADESISGVYPQLTPYLANNVVPINAGTNAFNDPAALWLMSIRSGDVTRPLACADVDGYLYFPATTGAGIVDYSSLPPHTAGWEVLTLPSVRDEHGAAMTDLAVHLARAVADHDSGGPPQFGLSVYLAAFNRKERFHLFNYAAGVDAVDELHAPGLRLSDRARADLEAVLARRIPPHAFVAIDYHLNWVYAALQWFQGAVTPLTPPPFPLRTTVSTEAGGVGAALIDGRQEDVDLLVSWADSDGEHLAAIEAKAYGAWSNTQWQSKLDRLQLIVDSAPDVDVRFILTSPREPEKLSALKALPAWARRATDVTEPAWMRLPAPRLRVATTRCTPTGEPDESGEHWKITKPH